MWMIGRAVKERELQNFLLAAPHCKINLHFKLTALLQSLIAPLQLISSSTNPDFVTL
jgi:hypothetical protein